MQFLKNSILYAFFSGRYFCLFWIMIWPVLTFGQGEKASSSIAEIELKIEQSQLYINRNLDSAFVFAMDAQELAKGLEEDEIHVKVATNLGDIYKAIGDFSSSFDHYLQARVLLDDLMREDPDNWNTWFLKIDLDLREGTLQYLQGNLAKCLELNEAALVYLEKSIGIAPDGEIRLRKLKVFNNIAGVYLQKSDFDTALQYYQNASELNKQELNTMIESTLSNNIGICYMEKGEHDLSAHYFLKSLSFRSKDGDKRGQAQVLNNMGKNMVLTARFSDALKYYEQALNLGRETGNGESLLKSLESLATLNDTLGNYKVALKTYKEFKALNDSMFGYETKLAISRLEDSYRRDKEKKTFEFEAQRLEAERQKSEIRNISIAIALFSLLLLSILIIVLLRGKIRNSKYEQEKLELEHQKLEIERQALQESVDYKDRELTANALYRLKNNELITKITDNLLKAKATFRNENQRTIQEIIAELRASQDNQVWGEFEAHFTRVHSSFYQTLQDQFPNITANERKLCAFLRLNMSTKDISAITNQSINSITVARSRLRKKLNIEGEEVNLINFLSQL